MGLAPHVMHHIGFLAGAAFLTGFLGNSLLYVVGLLLSIPLLRRLRRRFGTRKAPAIGVAVFTALFALSAFVIGPLFNPATPNQPDTPSPAASASASGTEDHEGHHSASPTP
jgi:MFS family permease